MEAEYAGLTTPETIATDTTGQSGPREGLEAALTALVFVVAFLVGVYLLIWGEGPIRGGGLGLAGFACLIGGLTFARSRHSDRQGQ